MVKKKLALKNGIKHDHRLTIIIENKNVNLTQL